MASRSRSNSPASPSPRARVPCTAFPDQSMGDHATFEAAAADGGTAVELESE